MDKMQRKERSSNLELMRILLMLLIIMHHYVVNSGVTDGMTLSNLTANSIFLQYWGMWGKTAINAFILISGYFLCVSQLTWQKYVKLFFQIFFYNIIIYLILLGLGYATLAPKEVFIAFGGIFQGIGHGFTSSFMAFYIFVPILNKLIVNINYGGVKRLLILLLFIQVITVTFFFSHAFNEVSWYMTLYIVGAYLRLWAGDWAKSLRFAGVCLLGTVLLAWFSVAVIDFMGYSLQKGTWHQAYYFVHDSSKILAFIIGIAVFLFFKNLPLPHSRFINMVAKTTFGVLLIHANSDAMRTMLWKHIVDVPAMVSAPLSQLILHAAGWAVVIFGVCSIIDYCRLRWIEPPVMNYIYEHSDQIEARITGMFFRR